MRTRLETIETAISFIEGLSHLTEPANTYEVEKIHKLLVTVDNRYLQTLIDFFASRKTRLIEGYHLLQLLDLASEGKKELLEITRDL